MYLDKWNLAKKPFENDLDLGFYYQKAKHHKEAHVRLLYAVEQKKPLALLIGESGVGKSYIARAAAAELLKKGNTQTARISAAGLDATALIRAVAVAFGIKASGSREETLAELEKALAKNAAKGHAALFIDNFEAAENKLLDELRTLLDMSAPDGSAALTIVIVGHPRLRGSLKRRSGIVNRLEVGYELQPFDSEEAQGYVLHRLTIAGGGESVFDEEGLAAVAEAAKGSPRQLNRICDLALLMGQIDSAEAVSAQQVEDALQELGELKNLGTGGSREGGSREGGSREGGKGRDGGGRDRDRDRDRDDDEGGRGGRGRRRRRKRGGGRNKSDDRDSSRGGSGGDKGGDDESDYDFNADDYSDIESMTEIITGSLKTHPSSGRRRRRSGARQERGDPLQYFDSGSGEVEANGDDDDDDSESSGRKRRRRRGRGRGRGRGRDEDKGGDESVEEAVSVKDEPKAEEAEKPKKSDEPKAEKPKAEKPKKQDEPKADFAAGLIEDEKKTKKPAKKKAAPKAEPEPASAPADSGFSSGLLEE